VRQPEWSRYWLGVATGDPDSEALQVGMEILGGARTSRLYRELVEKGVVVSAMAYSTEMEAPGMITVGGTPTPGKSLDDIKKAILDVTDRFLKEGPTPQELERAKRSLAASEIFARDNQMGMAEWYGSQMIAGQTVDQIEKWDDRVKAVTAEQVLAAMRKRMIGVEHVDATLLPEAR
jgi:zinc protease